MYDQIEKYSRKLIADRSAVPEKIAFAAQDDAVIAAGDAALAHLAASVLGRLNCLALCVAAPALPFARFLLQRAGTSEQEIVPRDTETRTFLHDIPILRHSDLGDDPAGAIARVLGNRKGVIVEGHRHHSQRCPDRRAGLYQLVVRVSLHLHQIPGRCLGAWLQAAWRSPGL